MKSLRSLSGLALIALLLAGANVPFAVSQSRRQPPTSNEKKNKRPDPPKEGEEKQDPIPPDIIGNPKEVEKVTIATQIVNVDAVVYHNKICQKNAGLKKGKFAIFKD
jgi:hypothetical protein